MDLKLSNSEKRLVLAAILAIIFFIYWYALLNPLLIATDKIKFEAKEAGQHLKLLKLKTSSVFLSQAGKDKIDIYPKEEQLNRIIKFMDNKFKWFGVNLMSLQQSYGENKIHLDLKFKSTYYQLLGFLDSLSELNTLLVIDNVEITQEGSHLITTFKIITGYL